MIIGRRWISLDAVSLCFLEGFTLVRPASLLDKVIHRRAGWRFLGWGRRPGWTGALPLYAKGANVTYEQGYEKRLEEKN